MKKKTLLTCQQLLNQRKNTPKQPIVLVLDNIRSGHNVGAAFRLSDALAIKHIYLCGISPIPPHPQIRKTALGAEDVVPWTHSRDTSSQMHDLKKQGYQTIAVELVESAVPLQQINHYLTLAQPLALVFGHEVFGIQQKVLDAVDLCVEIPQYGTKLSMNVTICMGIVVWEILRGKA